MSAQPAGNSVQPPRQYGVNSRQEIQAARQQEAQQPRETENAQAAVQQRQEQANRAPEAGKGQVIDVIG